MKKLLMLLLTVMLLLLVTACAGDGKLDNSKIDFSASAYKHLTNGGIDDKAGLPYNVDAITSATVTVEGPGVVASIPLSVRELENRTKGLSRGIYSDTTGKFIYEGIDLSYMLKDMVSGDNGIILTKKAYLVDLKNCNRETISTFKLEDVFKASAAGRPILLAYGKGTTDGKLAAPFVFDSPNKAEHSLGYVARLKNDDGCLRLVYDLDATTGSKGYKTFTNVAYVYIREATEPGFKHTGSDTSTYGSSKLTDYIVAFRGSGLGRELDLTVRQLEALAKAGPDGNPASGGLGYSDFYSLANTSYWYVNQYEGLDLYKLLLYMGMDPAEKMGTAAARTTLVSFLASDGKASAQSFSVDTLSYPDAFGFYKKNAADRGDGSYKPTNADLVKTGYPVLLAYGVNNYPYTIGKSDGGYLSGLQNNGGPLRVVFGKTEYSHPNGSYQVQYLSDVIVGKDVHYSTHKYTDNAPQAALQNEKLAVKVVDETGKTLTDTTLTVGDIEDILYGADVGGADVKAARVKDSYEVLENGKPDNAVYEGVDLEYLLMKKLGLPGTNGTVTFSGSSSTVTVTMSELFAKGYNTTLKRDGLTSCLAFAKSGSPLVPDAGSPGYAASFNLHPYLSTDPAVYTVDNRGGPLCVLLPSAGADTCTARAVLNLKSITVTLKPDAYAHTAAPYETLSGDSIRISGEGLYGEKIYSVSDLERMQTSAATRDYSILDSNGTLTRARYRGVSVYELLTEIGLKNNAGKVTVSSKDGTSVTYTLSQIKKQTYPDFQGKGQVTLGAILAFGAGLPGGDIMDGRPLVPDTSAPGYDATYGNTGGPLMLVMPQESENAANAGLCVKNVTAIEVTANKSDTWGHAMSDVYSEFLDNKFTLTIKNDDNTWTQDFTLRQLESLSCIRVRDKYSVLDLGDCEGIDLWKFVQLIAGSVPGIKEPVAFTVYGADGYKNDLLSVFYKDGLENGIKDENGDRKTLILCYAVNGYPLVDTESHEGYTGLAKNADGPMRIVAETNQGASVKNAVKLVVTIPGSGALPITVDQSLFDAAK